MQHWRRLARSDPEPSEHEAPRERVHEELQLPCSLGRSGSVTAVGIEAGRDDVPKLLRKLLGQGRGRLRELREAGVVRTRPLERLPSRTRVVERRSDPPHVRGGCDRATLRGIALLGRHVGVRADRAALVGESCCRLRDAQVDQACRRAHDDVARLHVEMDGPLAREVVQGRKELQT
jgi:hypothetical protein